MGARRGRSAAGRGRQADLGRLPALVGPAGQQQHQAAGDEGEHGRGPAHRDVACLAVLDQHPSVFSDPDQRALEEVQHQPRDEVAEARPQQLPHRGEAHGVRGLHVRRQQLPAAVLEPGVDRAEARAEQGGHDVEGVDPLLLRGEDVDKGHQQADDPEAYHRGGRDVETLGPDLGEGALPAGCLDRLRGEQCVQHRGHGGAQEKVDGDEAEVHLQADVFVDPHEVPQHEQQKKHGGGAAAEHEYAHAREGEAAEEPRGPHVRVDAREPEGLARHGRAAGRDPGGVLLDEQKGRDSAGEHHDQVAGVQPTVMEIREDCDHDVAHQAPDKEHGRPDGAGDLELLGREHLGADRLDRHVVEPLPDAPDEHAEAERPELAPRRCPVAGQDADGGHGDAQPDEEAPAERVGLRGDAVPQEPEQRGQQDAHAVDELCYAHEEGLVVPPQLGTLHGKQVR
mmetsp:Transcript_39659/g.106402  ORF Transcript_39659/g.106402 Transcript_39659/m.106402 type:complete len:453 (-) Transcript_39659:775-2133(-)